MSFERARKIADAVLLEGYVLYPYRATSNKNKYRWTFGVISPRSPGEAADSGSWCAATECLIAGERPLLSGRLRFLQVQPRQVEAAQGSGFAARERLDVDGEPHLSWEEGLLREVDFSCPVEHAKEPRVFAFAFAAEEVREPLVDRDGMTVGRIVRTRAAIAGEVKLWIARMGEAEGACWQVRARIENRSSRPATALVRSDAMPTSLVSAHLILSVTSGSFVSLIDPPPPLARAAASCKNRSLHPVLAGEPGRFDLLLCSPIILYDHPEIAPESPVDFCDSAEIDELLALRTLTLTSEERKLARATDARSRDVLDRVDQMSQAALERLHGGMRAGAEQGEAAPRAPDSGSGSYVPGMRVRLRPGPRRTDAQDLLYLGCSATIRRVLEDIDGRQCLAVTLDDDPAAELHHWYGRYHYYYVDELEPWRSSDLEASRGGAS